MPGIFAVLPEQSHHAHTYIAINWKWKGGRSISLSGSAPSSPICRSPVPQQQQQQPTAFTASPPPSLAQHCPHRRPVQPLTTRAPRRHTRTVPTVPTRIPPPSRRSVFGPLSSALAVCAAPAQLHHHCIVNHLLGFSPLDVSASCRARPLLRPKRHVLEAALSRLSRRFLGPFQPALCHRWTTNTLVDLRLPSPVDVSYLNLRAPQQKVGQPDDYGTQPPPAIALNPTITDNWISRIMSA